MEKFWLNYVMAYCKRQIATVERHERKASDIFSFGIIAMFLFNDNPRLSFQESLICLLKRPSVEGDINGVFIDRLRC
jgi:hypothetical protein